MARLIARLAGAGANSARLTMEMRSCVASKVGEMAPLTTVWGACDPCPAIKLRMCEIRA
ncbi:MAG: hypothetical protein HY718_12765 [Planctomycetes bacterium]|nr:hypothetical protein [Planctomycetota bacterium]